MFPTIFPPKLKKGDKIKVIAPARSLSCLKISKTSLCKIIKHWESLGLRVELAKHVNEKRYFSSASVEARVFDLHEAFRDKETKMILAVVGGFDSNQLLDKIDYELIKKNPKIFCGYSDITALTNAIYAKTGLVTYHGPFFVTPEAENALNYTDEYFTKCLLQKDSFTIISAQKWSNDNVKDKLKNNSGFWIINNGSAKGKIVGGNLCTFNLLQGTEFMPSLRDTVLFIEDDDLVKEYSAGEFDRNLQSILHLPDANKIRGVVIGRFQPASQITKKDLAIIIKSKKELKNIPVIANVDFGHTLPMITFPIGGEVRIAAKNTTVVIEIIKH